MSAGTRICVVTVVLNDAARLEETMRSVRESASGAGLDHLVIDGGSTDGTVDVIRKYADRLYYWISEPDTGIYDAMNKGWAAAPADSFILFLGAGDRLISLPDQMERFSVNDVVYGRVFMGVDTLFTPRADLHLRLYNSLHHQALLVHKACHPAAPFDTRYKIYADFDFNQRLSRFGARFVYAPSFLSYANPGGLSDQRDFSESLAIIRHNYGLLWAALALLGSRAMKLLPFLQRLRPYRKVRP